LGLFQVCTILHTMHKELKILSLNVGLTRLKFTPFSYNFVPFVTDRVRMLPSSLTAENADVICLQEVFENGLFKKLRAELKGIYPYAYHDNKGWKLFNKGLAIFSKYKFEHVSEVSFKTIALEKFAQKGASIIRFIQGPHDSLILANVHFPYGGYIGNSQAFAPIIALRNKAIEHLHQTLEGLGKLVIMAGDFNFGPAMAEQNYEYTQSLGYQNLTSEEITWDPENPMNKLFTLMKPQSLDHIFVNTRLFEKIVTVKNQVLFKESLQTPRGRTVNLSDHYGVVATILY
jgi:exonuclease III